MSAYRDAQQKGSKSYNVLSQALNTLDAVSGVEKSKDGKKRTAPEKEVQVQVVPVPQDDAQPKKKKQKREN